MLTHDASDVVKIPQESNGDALTCAYVEKARNPIPSIPQSVGRYRILRVLGDGGFGRVFLARDDVLNRDVAVKIPHGNRVLKASDVESYLTEARIVSSLDHPSIVTVFDCGQTDDGLFYIVSKYIDGSDLATRFKNSPYTIAAATELVAILAGALHFAHSKRIVHRDVKPANILIDSQFRPYLADFGIALREEDFGTGYTRLGTLPYMSPEQLRGEGHLVDGRSDVFSLGVVLYELISGRKPFPANRQEQSSMFVEPRSLRHPNDSIPRELERICLKALAYRVIDRYKTAAEMAADLRAFLDSGNATETSPAARPGLSGQSNNSSSGHLVSEANIQIVPKGLRSFDRDDAGFFLELLPGLRCRDGLPESVRFWQKRIQSSESEAFRVGVIYGPSGSGKSSFLKAGVLPLLSDEIIPIYVESTPVETEVRLLKALRRICVELPAGLGLAESMTVLRRNRPSGQRLLIVLDQFEQWLHSRSQGDSSELLKALRQCDGTHLQCIITVRDDFWMAVTHFMNELEVTLVPGDNLAFVDLFNVRHARKVLTAIGQAQGNLSTNPQEITKDQTSFINKAIADLTRNDQVIPVQLALFAEMVKNKAWTAATLKSVGGTEGVGVTFLEETFNARSALPHHRLHQKPARAVLQALLSEGASGIKGAMRSYDELLAVSGYADNPHEFDVLLRILDSDLRLITPTEPDGLDTGEAMAESSSNGSDRYYQLTHDYLVPSLQEWLTRKRKETRRGRAELVLADRASVWNKQHENRSLPSFLEWFVIMLFAGRTACRESRQLLNASAVYYGCRMIVGTLLLVTTIWGVRDYVYRSRAASLVESLASARCQDVPSIIEKIEPFRPIADPLLHDQLKSPSANTRLYAAMALLNVDRNQQSVVYDGMLDAHPGDFSIVCETLMNRGDKPAITRRLWKELFNPGIDPKRRFHVGAALAAFDAPDEKGPPSENWLQAARFLAERLVAEVSTNPDDYSAWVSALRPARKVLYSDLRRIFSMPGGREIDGFAAATVLANFVAEEPDKLADLVLLANSSQYGIVAPKLRGLSRAGKTVLQNEFDASAANAMSTDEQNRIAKRRAYAAVALVEVGVTEPLISVLSAKTDNPTLGSYIEDRLSVLAVHPEILCRLLDTPDVALRAALVRSLAGMKPDQISREVRESAIRAFTKMFQTDPDPGVHSATEWALRKWGLTDRLVQMSRELATSDPVNNRRWYINHQGQSMILFKGPIDSQMGSPASEADRDSDENIVTRRIQRDFSVCSTEVTIEQFLKFLPEHRHARKQDVSSSPNCPVATMTWYSAAEYCNWLSKVEGIPPEQWCYKRTEKWSTALTPNGETLETMLPEEGYLSRSGYRLLTEAEWEYACRSGAISPYSWGYDPGISSRYAQTHLNCAGRNCPVGSLCPSRFGLFDMHGNVSEWVHDLHKEKRLDGADAEEDLTERPDDSRRVVRGSNAGEMISYQRSANRSSARARTGLSNRTGFRIGRTIAVLNPQ